MIRDEAKAANTAATVNRRGGVFDPPLCCPTGLCGADAGPDLLDVNEMVRALQSRRAWAWSATRWPAIRRSSSSARR